LPKQKKLQIIDENRQEIPRSDFLIPIADNQWGLDWIDRMVSNGLLIYNKNIIHYWIISLKKWKE